jgi:hypothetical protein
MTVPAIITTSKQNSPLVKAQLKQYNGEAPTIEFMFNPTELSLARTVTWKAGEGNRGDTLLPKINFSGVEPYKLTLKQLLFDTYETKESVMKYINIIRKGVETIDRDKDKRPPVYILAWGKDTEYFHCVMTSLTYTLTMFLSDGTPVRAMVDIALQEVEKTNLPGGKPPGDKGKDRAKDKRIGK